MDRMLRAEEAAELLGVKVCTVRKMILDKRLEVVRIGGRAVRIPMSYVEDVLARGGYRKKEQCNECKQEIPG